MGDEMDTVERYDPATDMWHAEPPMLTRRGFLAAVTLDGMIYAIGGFSHSDVPVVERYDRERRRWEAMPPMARARSNHGVAVLEGQIYVFFGESGRGNCFSDCETFRPAGNGGACP